MNTKILFALLCAVCIGFIGCSKKNVSERQTNTVKIRDAETPALEEQKSTLETLAKTVPPTYADLALPSGLKWATCNVGANAPEEYGDYFAWGETNTKTTYDWITYKYSNGSSSTMTKYCMSSSDSIVDSQMVLDTTDDVAYAHLGGSWRMPTYDEWYELKNKCTWTWRSANGINGYQVTGENGHSIFLPAAGYRNDNALYDAGVYGDYWSSSLDMGDPLGAYYLAFYSGCVFWGYGRRRCGRSVRPVCP